MERNLLMNTRTKTGFAASFALLCVGLLASSLSVAGEKPVSLKYAGSGWDTHVDGVVADGHNVSLSTGSAQGTFGHSTITITAEFTPADIACPADYPREYALVYSATVLTFPDQSQLFGIAQTGWICATSEGVYFGEVSGAYVGGTGRFQTATGDFVSKFDGAYLEPTLNFRSIRGTVEGSVARR